MPHKVELVVKEMYGDLVPKRMLIDGKEIFCRKSSVIFNAQEVVSVTLTLNPEDLIITKMEDQ